MKKASSIYRSVSALALATLVFTANGSGLITVDHERVEAIAAQHAEFTTHANLSRSVRQPAVTTDQLLGGTVGYTTNDAGVWGETDGTDSRYQSDTVTELASRPDASKTIFLDFDGAILTDTVWSKGDSEGRELIYPALTLDKASESDMRAVIYYTWAIVSENFAQFDVNVTTRVPEPAQIIRASEEDSEYGVHVVFTNHELDGMEHCECAGIASMSEFGNIAPDITPSPAFVNPNFGDDGYGARSPASAAWVLAHIATHEIGHTLGLEHDGTGDEHEYGKPIGPLSFFMGSTPAASKYARWSNGLLASTMKDFAGRMVQRQDDLTILAGILGLLPDDMPDSIVDEEVPSVDSDGRISGLLSDHNDVDVFRVYVPSRSVVKVEGRPAAHNYQLAAAIDIYDSDNTRLTPLTDERRWRTKFENGKAYYTDFSIDRHHVVVEPGWLTVRVHAGSGWPFTPDVQGQTYGSLGSWESRVTILPLDEDLQEQYEAGATPLSLFMQISAAEKSSHLDDMDLTRASTE